MTILKTVAIISTILILVNADWKASTTLDLAKYRSECSNEKKIPAEYLVKFETWQFPDDAITRCYLECLFVKMGLFDPKNGYNVDNLVKQLHNNDRVESDIRKDIESCIDKNEQNTDSCSWVFRGFKCFIAKHFMLVKESIIKPDKIKP